MSDLLMKLSLCLCLIVCGSNTAFCDTLSSVLINSDNNNNNITLITDKKSIEKNVINNNHIVLKLKNTEISDNIKTITRSENSTIDVAVIQNKNNTFVDITGNNISKFNIVNENNTIIPITKSFNTCSLLFVIILISCIISALNKKSHKKSEIIQTNVMNNIKKEISIELEQKRIQELKTLRNKIKEGSYMQIHSSGINKFSNLRAGVTIPKELNLTVIKNMNNVDLRNVVNR